MASSPSSSWILTASGQHDGPIRCVSKGIQPGEVLTGCQSAAPCLRRWKVDLKQHSMIPIGEPIYHDHWVTAVTSIPSSICHENFFPNGGFVTGCMDSVIRIFNDSGILVATAVGHEKGIISLNWSVQGWLISGSWDGTARVWDLSSIEQSMELEDGIPKLSFTAMMAPHENGVQVLPLTNGIIVTSSTGEAVNGKPANFHLRHWMLSDDSSVKMVSGPHTDHLGPIRGLSSLPSSYGKGYLTCSNDGTVAIRSEDSICQTLLMHPIQADGSPPFILGCTSMETADGQTFASCGEDGSVIIWYAGQQLASIPHPKSVWAVCSLSSPEPLLLTACHDGSIRAFAPRQDGEDLVAESMHSAFAAEVSQVKSSNGKASGPSDEELSRAPMWEDRLQHPGRQFDDIQVFRKEGGAIAAQWDGNEWKIIGEVVSGEDESPTGESINGILFQHVLPVELETPTGLRMMKLGYNDGENPVIAAQRFVNDNSLPSSHVNTVADWIVQRIPSAANYSAYQANSSATKPVVSSQLDLSQPLILSFSKPISAYAYFSDLPPVDKLQAKLREFATANSTSSLPGAALTDDRLSTLLDFTSVLCGGHTPVGGLSKETVYAQLSILNDLLHAWPSEQSFILLDLLRLAVLHLQYIDGFTSTFGVKHLLSILSTACKLAVRPAATHAVAMTATRVFANLFKSDLLVRTISSQPGDLVSQILEIAVDLSVHSHKLVRAAAICLLYNFTASSAVFTSSPMISVHHLEVLQRGLMSFCLSEECQTVEISAVRVLQVIGTVLSRLPASSTINVFVKGDDGEIFISSLSQLLTTWNGRSAEIQQFADQFRSILSH